MQQAEQNSQSVVPEHESFPTVKAVEASSDESNEHAAMVLSDSDSKGAYYSIYNVCICLILVFLFHKVVMRSVEKVGFMLLDNK